MGNIIKILGYCLQVYLGQQVSLFNAFNCFRTVREGRKDMFYLTTHSTHFIYVYMASGIW